MKRFVRHIAMSLIAGLICLQGSVSAQESQSVYPGGQATMLSTGSVKMSTDLITVSLPIRIDFSIDPNQIFQIERRPAFSMRFHFWQGDKYIRF